MVDAPEKQNFFSKLTETVKSLAGKLTQPPSGPVRDDKGRFAPKSEGIKNVPHNVAAVGEDVMEKVGELKGKLPEPAEKAINTARDKAGEVVGKLTKDMKPEQVAKLKEGGLVAGGTIATLDGVRRIAQKDENGKRHVVKGAVEAGVGIGMFTAAVMARRNGVGSDGHGKG